MKKLILLPIFILCFSIYSQNNTDTIQYLGDCLISNSMNMLFFELKDDTLTITGELEGNCCGYNFLLYYLTNDSIIMTRDHTGDACYCSCMFEVNYKIGDIMSDSIRIIIHPYIIDTIIYAQTSNIYDNYVFNNEYILCYPNPFYNIITIEFPNPVLSNFTFILFDSNGRNVKTINNIISNKLIIYRNNLKNGVYYFQLHDHGNKFYNGKIIVE